MSGEPLASEEIRSLFEAARFAPSCYNDQPWQFHIATHGSKKWSSFFDLLVPFNQQWCERAALLGISVGRNRFAHNQKPNRTFAYDCGAAWENLALQGHALGLVVHGMAGFDYEKAATILSLGSDWEVLAMFAVGRPGPLSLLPKEMQSKEVLSSRKPLTEVFIESE
jgi:nitroreductase